MSVLLEAREWLSIDETIQYIERYFPETRTTQQDVLAILDEGHVNGYIEILEQGFALKVTDLDAYIKWLNPFRVLDFAKLRPLCLREINPCDQISDDLYGFEAGSMLPLELSFFGGFRRLANRIAQIPSIRKEREESDDSDEDDCIWTADFYTPLIYKKDSEGDKEFFVPTAFRQYQDYKKILVVLDGCTSGIGFENFLDHVRVMKADIEHIKNNLAAKQKGGSTHPLPAEAAQCRQNQTEIPSLANKLFKGISNSSFLEAIGIMAMLIAEQDESYKKPDGKLTPEVIAKLVQAEANKLFNDDESETHKGLSNLNKVIKAGIDEVNKKIF
jgi:hypothetical protein